MVCQGDTLMKDQSVSAWGLARSSRVLRANPVDVPIGQVVDQDVVRVSKWRQNRRLWVKSGHQMH